MTLSLEENQLREAGWERINGWWRDPASGSSVCLETALRWARKDSVRDCDPTRAEARAEAWAAHAATHTPPNGIELYQEAQRLGWSPSALARAWPHRESALFALSVDAETLEVVRRDPEAPWLPGAREIYRRAELESDLVAQDQKQAEKSAWCPCCAYAQSCDGCIAARRAAAPSVVTLCMCAGRAPGLDQDGHAPGCPDADQPWGPPYLYPVYQTVERWRRVDDPNHWRGFRWEKDVYTRVSAWRRVSEHTSEGAVSEEMQEQSQEQSQETMIAVLDTETTGLFERPRGFVPRIVEIAVSIVSVPSGRVVAFRSARVNPEAPIPFGASNVHKIFDRDVRNERTWAEIYPRVAKFIEEHNVACVVAHNANFDRDMVLSDCARIGADGPRWSWLDSMKLARRHLPGRHSYALQKLREGLQLPEPQHGDAHSAAADVGTVGQLVVRCLRNQAWEDATEGLIERPNPLRTEPQAKAKASRATQQSLSATGGSR